MKKKKTTIIIISIIIVILIAVGLCFILSKNKKETTSTTEKVSSTLITTSEIEELTESTEQETTTTSSNITTTTKSLVTTTTTKQEKASTFTQQSFKTSEGITLKYWLYTPSNPTNNMPLIIYLHGGTAKGDDINKVVEGSLPKYIKDGEISNINAYVIMPQVPSNYKGWSDIKVSLRDLITNVKNTYSINPNKISLTGHSMGGKGTYDIALAYPDLFSCIAPMSGSITVNDTNINKLKNIPIWAFVGSSDTIVNPSTSTNFLTEVKKYNSNSKLTTFDGATHFDVPELGYKQTDVINWLINNSK